MLTQLGTHQSSHGRPEVDDETPEKEKMEKPKKAKNEEKAKMEENAEQIWVG